MARSVSGSAGGLAAAIAERAATAAISVGESDRRLHSEDLSFHQPRWPDVVVYARSTEDVRGVLEYADAHRIPVVPFGVGSSLDGHVIPVFGGIALDLSRMDQILAVRPNEMTATVQAGVRRIPLEKRLAEDGLMFPVDPGADATLGGMAATNAAGTMTVRYGKMRAQVLALTAVLPGGQVIQTGTRASKTSAGYDITGLLVGSEGTLAVITDLTLRVHPIPEGIVVARASFADVERASQVACAIVANGLMASRVELIDEWEVLAANEFAGSEFPEAPMLFIELSGPAEVLAAELDLVRELAEDGGGYGLVEERDPTRQRHLWRIRHDLFFAEKAMARHKEVLSTDVCVPLEELGAALRATREAIDRHRLTGGISAHAGDGNVHAAILVDPADEQEMASVGGLIDELVDDALARGGTCSGEHGIGLGKISALIREHGEQIALMRSLKAAFDPNGIMNPGKVLPAADPGQSPQRAADTG